MEYWKEQREAAMDDLKFYANEQWDNMDPANITVNCLPPMVKQIENALRQQDISIQVYPTDDIASEDTAEVFSGIIREIERKSHAHTHYIRAAGEAGALVPGFGFLKLQTKYIEGTDLQEIIITSPSDPFKVVPYHNAKNPDSSDAECWFEFEDYPLETFKQLWPGADPSSFNAYEIEHMPNSEECVRVITYWWKESLEYVEFTLEDGSKITTIDVYDPNEAVEDIAEGETCNPLEKMMKHAKWPKKLGTKPVPILRSRKKLDSKVKWAIMTNDCVIETGDWADSEFPFVSIYGPTLTLDSGRKHIRGVIRYAKDSQRMLNYLASSAIKRISSANKSPWIADAKSIKNYMQYWQTANTEQWSVLPFDSVDPDDPNRQLIPPQRADQRGQIDDLLMGLQKFEDNIKRTMGIYDAGLGQSVNDQSGEAIKSLAQQGQNANYHFSDALQGAIERLGYLLVRLIQKVYDTPRAVRTIGADTKAKIVKVNQVFNGDGELFDLTSGVYGVQISAGPAYATRKQEAINQITQILKVNPSIAPFVQDVLVGEMDFNGADVLQRRLMKVLAMTNPQLVEGEDSGEIPPQVSAQMAQMQAMIQKLGTELQLATQHIQKLETERITKQIEHQGQIAVIQAQKEAQKEVELVKAHVAIKKHEATAQADVTKTILNHQADLTKTIVTNPHLMENK